MSEANANITDHLINISAALGRVEGKLNSVDAKLDKHIESDEEQFADHDKRIRRGENIYFKVMGAAAAISAVVGAAWKAIAG